MEYEELFKYCPNILDWGTCLTFEQVNYFIKK